MLKTHKKMVHGWLGSSERRESKKERARSKKKDGNLTIQKISVLTASLEQLQNSLTVADDSIKEGNEQLKQLLTQKNFTKKRIYRELKAR